jgi:hypothetical protein
MSIPPPPHNCFPGPGIDVPRIYRPPIRTRQPFPEAAGSKLFARPPPACPIDRPEAPPFKAPVGSSRALRMPVESEIGCQARARMPPHEAGWQPGGQPARGEAERLIRSRIPDYESASGIDFFMPDARPYTANAGGKPSRDCASASVVRHTDAREHEYSSWQTQPIPRATERQERPRDSLPSATFSPPACGEVGERSPSRSSSTQLLLECVP